MGNVPSRTRATTALTCTGMPLSWIAVRRGKMSRRESKTNRSKRFVVPPAMKMIRASGMFSRITRRVCSANWPSASLTAAPAVGTTRAILLLRD